MANINDIATMTNYNGKPLLDGRYYYGKTKAAQSGAEIDDEGIAVNKVKGMFANSGLYPATANATDGKTNDAVSWINGRPVLEGNAGT